MALGPSERIVASLKVLLNGLPTDEAAEILAVYLSSNSDVAQALHGIMHGGSVRHRDVQGLVAVPEVTAVGLEGVAAPRSQSWHGRDAIQVHAGSDKGSPSSRSPQQPVAATVGRSPLHRPAVGGVNSVLQDWGRQAVADQSIGSKARSPLAAVEFTMQPSQFEAKPKPAQSEMAAQRQDGYEMGAATMYRAQHMLCRLGDIGKHGAPPRPSPAPLRVRRSLALRPTAFDRAQTRSMPAL